MAIDSLLRSLEKGSTMLVVGPSLTLEDWEKLLQQGSQFQALYAQLPSSRKESCTVVELLALHLKERKSMGVLDLSESKLNSEHIEILGEAFGLPALTDERRNDFDLPETQEMARRRRGLESRFKKGIEHHQKLKQEAIASLEMIEAKREKFALIAHDAAEESTQYFSEGNFLAGKARSGAYQAARRLAEEADEQLKIAQKELQNINETIDDFENRLRPACITHLILADNNIGDAGAFAIAKILHMGIGKSDDELPIKNLDLRNNSLSSQAILAIADALLAGARLESLDLTGNTIDPEVAEQLARAAKMHPSLIIKTNSPQELQPSKTIMSPKFVAALQAEISRLNNSKKSGVGFFKPPSSPMQAALQALVDVAQGKPTYLEPHLAALQQSKVVRDYVASGEARTILSAISSTPVTSVSQFITVLDTSALPTADFRTKLLGFIGRELERLEATTETGFFGIFTRYFTTSNNRQIEAFKALQQALQDSKPQRLEQFAIRHRLIIDLDKNPALVRFINQELPEASSSPSPILSALSALRPPESRDSAAPPTPR